MDLTYNKEKLNKIKEKFVVNNLVSKESVTDMSIFKGHCIIYLIVNLKNGKKYIGSTVDFNDRVNHYIHACLNYEYPHQKISRIMKSEGIENFIIIPIDTSKNRYDLRSKEREYIRMYNTMDPNIGYNDVLPPENEAVHSFYKGHSHTAKTKANKAKFIAAINDTDKIMYISEGLKLFADITNSSKDLVKNEAKTCRRHRGYFIIYLNSKDRISLYDKAYNNLLDIENDIYHTPTKRSRWRAVAKPYVECANMVSLMLDEGSSDVFVKNGYTCHYLHYDLSEKSNYIIDPIDKFFETVNLDSFNNR